MAAISLHRRLEVLEALLLPNPDRVAFGLYVRAIDGDEPARLDLVKMCINFTGKSRINEVAAAAGLLAGPIDQEALRDETGDFCFQESEPKETNRERFVVPICGSGRE